MDLKSGYPFWAVKNGLMHAFDRMQQDQSCDVAVIGGGITGTLIANELAQHGHDVLLLEQRDIAWGSTAASTALLQYEIDTHMTDLARQYGEDSAVLAYRACADAIPMLQSLAGQVRDVDFARMKSLYYASKRRHYTDLRDEFQLRKTHGFDVRWYEPQPLRDEYGIDAPAAILSALAARVDPYRFVYRLLTRLQRQGVRIFDRTAMTEMSVHSRGVLLQTDTEQTIRSKYVVLAAGYANEKWLDRRVARNRSSYAFITDPLSDDALGQLRDTMIWESARPYLYMRATGDGRLLIGGEDDAVDIPSRRDRRVESKSGKLLKKMGKLFPDVPLIPAFSWAGTFAETADGLPFFGPDSQHGSRVQYAMAYGGNGITYSMIGAGLIRALIERRRHPLSGLFTFARLRK